MVADLKRGSVGRRGSVLGGGEGEARRQSVLGVGEGEGGMDARFGGELERGENGAGEQGVGQGVGAAAGSVSGRGRSLSGTLNELWRGWRGTGNADLESGESVGGELPTAAPATAPSSTPGPTPAPEER